MINCALFKIKSQNCQAIVLKITFKSKSKIKTF